MSTNSSYNQTNQTSSVFSYYCPDYHFRRLPLYDPEEPLLLFQDNEKEITDFPNHKNICKTNKQGTGKFKSITRGKYKCPIAIDNCLKNCGGDRHRLRGKAARKAQKTKKLDRRQKNKNFVSEFPFE